jgi:hypothetical protein
MKKNIGLCIFALIHLYYIIRLLSNGEHVYVISIPMVVVAFTYLWGFVHYPHNPTIDAARIPTSVISASIGGICCYLLSQKAGPVLACGIVGILASFLTHLFTDKKFHELPYSTYCGCFVGMSTPAVLPNVATVAVLAGFSGLLFATTKRSLEGVGGKLGSISFASVVCYLLIHNYI